MITLTIRCERCSKEVSHDLTGSTFNDDVVRKLGFVYKHDGKTNVTICMECERQYKDLKDKLASLAHEELCSFFNTCGEEEENGDNRGKKVG
jgi:hypothetical protein